MSNPSNSNPSNTVREKDNQSEWELIADNLRSLFIDPSHEHENNLCEDINAIQSSMPDKEGLPYVGTLNDSFNYLSKFEALPEGPQDKKIIFKALANAMSGALKWHHPNVMHNVVPSPLVSTVAASAIVNLYNLNPVWDFMSAGSHKMERQIARQLARMAKWEDDAGGICTSGGKGCITYALRIGLNRCTNNLSSTGLQAQDKSPVVITSEENHYCIDTAAALLGIGYDNVWRAAVNDDETMNMTSFRDLVEKACMEGRPIAALIACGGSSLHLTMDNIKEMSSFSKKMVQKYQLNYKPYLYFDTCVGWPWIFFIDYDFENNPLGIPDEILGSLFNAIQEIASIKIADGFGVDFHKTGLCPYSTSMFITKNGDELNSIFKDELEPFDIKPEGGNFLHSYTVEHSRTAAPVFAAWTTLQILGINGFRSYLCNLLAVGNEIRKILPEYQMELLNSFSYTQASVFFPVPDSAPLSYWDLVEQDKSTIEKYNEYTFRLFEYFQDKDKNQKDSFIFRFVPQYRKAKCGANMAVIVIYPMSMYLEMNNIKDIAHSIGKIKQAFDKIYDSSDIPNFMPEHVIK